MNKLLNKIHHMDCMDLLAKIPDASIDMVLCDLPYGVTACNWDTIIPIEPMWVELKRIVKPRSAIVLTATQPFSSRLVSSNYEMFRHEWIWDKVYSSNPQLSKYQPLKHHEHILIYSRTTPNYYPIMTPRKKSDMRSSDSGIKPSPKYIGGGETYYKGRNGKPLEPKTVLTIHGINNSTRKGRKFHPTEKPVALFEYLIRTYTQENEIVLDMTCGSGTTAIASRNLNRQFICGDYHLPYVEIARERLQNTDPYQPTVNKDGSKQLSLFEEGNRQ